MGIYPASFAPTRSAVPVFASQYAAAGGLPPVGEYLGVIIEPPAAWSGDNQVSAGRILDLRQYRTESPYRYALLAGRDHVGDSTCGAYMWVSNSLTGGWTFYDSTVSAAFEAAGWSSPPSANPVATIAAASDKGEWPEWGYDPVNDRFIMTMHAQSYLVGQTERIFTSTDALTWTEQGSPYDTPSYANVGHNGYGTREWGAMGFRGQSVFNDLGPLSYQQVYSRGGLDFAVDFRRMYGRDCAHWGYTDKEMPKSSVVLYFDGRPWQIGGFRDVPSSGGASTNGILVAAPLSSDHRRWVGPPVVLAALGGSGTDHELSTSDGHCYTYVDSDGTAYVTHQVEDSSNVRRIGLTKITPRDAERPWVNPPTYAVSIQSGFEAALAFDAEGLPIPASTEELREISDINFAVITSTPSDVTETVKAGTPTFTYNSIATTRGELAILVNAASEDGVYYFGPTIDLSDHQEAWVQADGMVATDNVAIQIGFGDPTLTDQVWLDIRRPPEYGRLGHYQGASVTYGGTGEWTIFEDDRKFQSVSVRFGITKRLMGDKTQKVYLEFWCEDQVIGKRDITSIYTDITDARAFFRVFHRGVTSEVRVTRLRAWVASRIPGS